MEIKTKRCCMCPNDGSSRVCPGYEHTLHKEDQPCEFVLSFRDDKGEVVFVGGIGDVDVYMSFRSPNGKGRHRVKSPQLPVRRTFDEAQSDLNRYAIRKKWRIHQ